MIQKNNLRNWLTIAYRAYFHQDIVVCVFVVFVLIISLAMHLSQLKFQ